MFIRMWGNIRIKRCINLASPPVRCSFLWSSSISSSSSYFFSAPHFPTLSFPIHGTLSPPYTLHLPHQLSPALPPPPYSDDTSSASSSSSSPFLPDILDSSTSSTSSTSFSSPNALHPPYPLPPVPLLPL